MSIILAAVAATSLSGGAPAASQAEPAPLHVERRIAGPDGGWDYVSSDPARGRLYFSRSYGIMALDLDTGRMNEHFAGGSVVHSVVVIPGTDDLLTTNSGDNTARVIDASTGALRTSLPTGVKPDAAVYDPASGLVFVMNAKSGDSTVIDPKTWRVTATIEVGGGLEFAVADGRGHVFVNVEDRNEMAVIDTRKLKLAARYPLPGCEGPTGMALTAADVLIAACANQTAKLIDAGSGRDLGGLPIGLHPDAVVYDAARARAYTPCGDSAEVVVIANAGGRHPKVIVRAESQRGAKTAGLDRRSGRLYLPTARMTPPAEPQGRWTPAPGTFQVLVMGR
jgi:YVTN family beta-propeller protein